MTDMASNLAGRLAVVTGGGSRIVKVACKSCAKHDAAVVVIDINNKGGGSGIGKSVCQLFARQGATVAVVDINNKSAEETARSLSQNTNSAADHTSYAVDISSRDAVEKLFKNLGQTYTALPPSVLVNSAGITKDDFLMNMQEQSFDDVISVNLKGTFLMTQAISQAMVQAKVKYGTVVNIASIVAKVGNLGQCNYSASKAGVEGFSRTAAKELAKFGIRCNVVVPGFIETPMTTTVPDKVLDKFRGAIPLGRLGLPEDVADVCFFLASQQSSYITGTSIEVTGGLFM